MIDIDRLYAVIIEKGENFKQAARVMNISEGVLLKKISGMSDFYRDEIVLFCKHYNVSPDVIFFAKEFAKMQNKVKIPMGNNE